MIDNSKYTRGPLNAFLLNGKLTVKGRANYHISIGDTIAYPVVPSADAKYFNGAPHVELRTATVKKFGSDYILAHNDLGYTVRLYAIERVIRIPQRASKIR